MHKEHDETLENEFIETEFDLEDHFISEFQKEFDNHFDNFFNL